MPQICDVERTSKILHTLHQNWSQDIQTITRVPDPTSSLLSGKADDILHRVLLSYLSGGKVFPSTILQLPGHIAQPPTEVRNEEVKKGTYKFTILEDRRVLHLPWVAPELRVD